MAWRKDAHSTSPSSSGTQHRTQAGEWMDGSVGTDYDDGGLGIGFIIAVGLFFFGLVVVGAYLYTFFG